MHSGIPAPRLASIALDCSEPEPLARFWAALLDGEVVFVSDGFCAVKTTGVYVATVAVPDHVPATWPGGQTPKQFHLDLAVDDLDEAVERAVSLGAVLAETQPGPDRYRVLIDPAGHPFCVSNQIP